MKHVAVILMNLGGPNNEEAVQPFLYNLFMDEDIIRIPRLGGLKGPLVKFLTTRRAKTVSRKYAQINACPEGCLGPKTCANRVNGVVSACCSSTNPITEWQRRALEKMLNQRGAEDTRFKVITAMRYWKPTTDEAIDQLLEGDFDEVVLLPLYPHFSFSTTASGFNDWWRQIRARDLQDRWKTRMVKDYPLHPKFLQAINQRIDEALEQKFPAEVRDQVHLLFSAHGTPVYFKEEGDPYSYQIKATMEAVMNLRNHDRPYWQSYQSRVGPIKWLQPNTENFIKVLNGYGVQHLLVIPIAFVSDHIETLMEIGIEFREVADELGMENFQHTDGINDMPVFVEGLAELVEGQLFSGEKLDDVLFSEGD